MGALGIGFENNQTIQTKMNLSEAITSISCGFTHSIVSQNYYCFGTPAFNSNACSGRGECTGTDQCTCKQNYIGTQCEQTYCSGIRSNDTRVCSGFGNCTDFDVCVCDPQFASDYSGDKDCYRNIMVLGSGYNGVICLPFNFSIYNLEMGQLRADPTQHQSYLRLIITSRRFVLDNTPLL
jgi:hypothetical protein